MLLTENIARDMARTEELTLLELEALHRNVRDAIILRIIEPAKGLILRKRVEAALEMRKRQDVATCRALARNLDALDILSLRNLAQMGRLLQERRLIDPALSAEIDAAHDRAEVRL